MRGYFGALMRASGLAIAGKTAPIVAAAEPRAIGMDIDRHRQAVPPRIVQDESIPKREAVFSAAPNVGIETQPVVPSDSSSHDAHGLPADAPPSVQVDAPSARFRAEDLAAVPPPRPIDTPTTPSAEAVLRAAIDWVAADPQRGRNLPGTSSRTPGLPSDNEGAAATVGTRAQSRPNANTAPADPNATSRHARAPDVKLRESIEAAVRPARSVPDDPVPASVPAAPPRDDVVEVSIGSIHVRVDAATPQTVARPTLTPPPAPRRTHAGTPGRSALSRRALRRI